MGVPPTMDEVLAETPHSKYGARTGDITSRLRARGFSPSTDNVLRHLKALEKLGEVQRLPEPVGANGRYITWQRRKPPK